jgi:hypothetical protein
MMFFPLLCFFLLFAVMCFSWMVSHGYMCPCGQYMWTSTVEHQRICEQDTVHEILIAAKTKHSKEETTAQNTPFSIILNYS